MSKPRVFSVPVAEWSLITGDLNEARQFLWTLKKVEGSDVDAVAKRKALTLAATVAYCRPFKSSRTADDKRKVWIPEGLVDDLPAELKTLHKKLETDRDQAWAHTDWEAHQPVVTKVETGHEIRSNLAWFAFEPAQIDPFLKLIFEVEGRLERAD
jgi:hypothetical protein